MASFLITGASRGFGLALTKEILSRPATEVSTVIASSRGPSSALNGLASKYQDRLMVTTIDVTKQPTIQAAAAEVESKLGAKGLDVLVNNAGIATFTNDGVKSVNDLQESFMVNVMGVHWTTQAFLPLLQKGKLKKVANISTTLGSTTLAPFMHFMPAPSYKISKAAMNALTVQYALDFEKDGFAFVALAPGWMKTELGGGDAADLTPEEAAKASLDIIYKPNEETNGKLPKVLVKGWENSQFAYDGSNAPW